ncbi:MAG TPA: PIG-L deacetylase family protein [Acidimicrobiia bacterium]|jgi:LmbE family N-acetylglucosaminyl deacetylase
MTLEVLPEDWDRALAVVAHPDDMEYGAASAVAKWTAGGKWVGYVLVTRGEAGIESMPPEQAGPLRVEEQRQSCAAVGVDTLEFLDHPDGTVVADLALRADIAGAIRRHRPEMIVSINYRDSWGGPSWNHADHRCVGTALLDAVRDAANPWVFPEHGPAWNGVRGVAFGGSPAATHFVDVSGWVERGIASLRCHAIYLANLGDDGSDPGGWLRDAAAAAGSRAGVEHAVEFEFVGA